MIKVENLSYWYSQKILYDKISFTIEEGQHCAFIGVNGSGKTSLIDLIINPEEHIFDGLLELKTNCKIGYISQFSKNSDLNNLSVYEYISQDYLDLQKKLEFICIEMETGENIEELLDQYQLISDKIDAIGGDSFEMTVNKQLQLTDLIKYKDLPVKDLSGGEFKIIQIIKEMLSPKDIMIMDEPDVFLDFNNINSLKNLINTYKGTLLVITHNRYLLNHCFNKILHIENKSLQEFQGTYRDYNFSLLSKKIELQELAYIDSEEIKRNDKLIEKYRFAASINADASIGKYVSARAKIQERLIARRVEEPFVFVSRPKIQLKADSTLDSDSSLLELKDFKLEFDELLLENINFTIKANEKVAIIGPNGTGKSSLLREIYKNSNDSIILNPDAKLAYLSQIQNEMLNESNTVFEELFDSGFKSRDEILSSIEKYGFDELIANQKISKLSGGEKNLLQLIKVSNLEANMLILDEPTSHLDTYSQVALENALKNYNGSILMTSHDFYSIINSMDYLLIIEDKNIRRMSIKKFKKMVYKDYLDREYIDQDQTIFSIQSEIESALEQNDFLLAKALFERFNIPKE